MVMSATNGKTELRLTVVFDPVSRSLYVDGPIQDKATCYMLLELAKDAVRENVDRAAGSRIVRPQLSVIKEK